ncbi:MAG: hypothetical protein NC483_00785 [Ruminococcus sp.]|nr:hypothetical protein [Ruminococcus sp.]
MKKLKVLQIFLVLIIVFFIGFLIMPKNYTKKYKVNDIEVIESYNKFSKYYYFVFNFNGVNLDYLVESRYKEHRGFIKDIEVIKDSENENNFCLQINSKLNINPLCYQDDKVIYYKKVNKNLREGLNVTLNKEEKISSYNDIDIYNDSYKYLLWNYNGFYYISNEEKKKIDIFDKELYTVNLIGYTANYLVVPDYDASYTFNRFYVVDFKSGNLKKYDLNKDIYFDSYFMGYLKNKIYFVDKKEGRMYEFNAKKGKLDKFKTKIYKDGVWEEVNIKTLQYKKQEFSYKTNNDYTLDGNTLYLNYHDKDIKMEIADNVTSIVRIKDQDIFYLKKDSLYHFNKDTGEELLLSYFEWNFNFENMIYIN